MKRFNTRMLLASHRPKCLYTYWVTGAGNFPFDMLRYDSAWPARSLDAVQIEWDAKYDRRHRSIMLNSYQEPTIDRWSSFNWSVGEEAVKKETI